MWQLQTPQVESPKGEYQIATIALDSDGEVIAPMRLITGAEAIAQLIRNRLNFWLGEWFLDQRLGVPYRRDILIKNPDQVLVSSIFRKVVEDTRGVEEVTAFDAKLDPSTRTLFVTFEARLGGGTVLIASEEPFIYKEAA